MLLLVVQAVVVVGVPVLLLLGVVAVEVWNSYEDGTQAALRRRWWQAMCANRAMAVVIALLATGFATLFWGPHGVQVAWAGSTLVILLIGALRVLRESA